MPIYEYKCEECETVSDILVKSISSPEVECPDCQSDKMSKLISIPGAMMTKGSVPDMPPACPNATPACGSHGCPSFRQ